MASQDWFEKDFYKILGVPKDADEAAIKKAYRKLARQYHPDKNPGDTVAEQKFKEIGEAHSVLSDPTQREEYDAIRQMAAGGARFTAGGPGSAGNGGFEDGASTGLAGAAPSGLAALGGRPGFFLTTSSTALAATGFFTSSLAGDFDAGTGFTFVAGLAAALGAAFAAGLAAGLAAALTGLAAVFATGFAGVTGFLGF